MDGVDTEILLIPTNHFAPGYTVQLGGWDYCHVASGLKDAADLQNTFPTSSSCHLNSAFCIEKKKKGEIFLGWGTGGASGSSIMLAAHSL